MKPAENIFASMLRDACVHATSTRLIAAGVLPAGIDQSRIVVEPPRDAAHGDMATNAAMVLAKEARQEAARARRSDRREAAHRR